VNLYGSLRQAFEDIEPSELTWEDPEASMVLSDDSDVIKNLGRRQKNVFLEPRENMKCALPDSILTKCDKFVKDFNRNTSQEIRNVFMIRDGKKVRES